jgi:acetyl-CoA carboxylase biotin carboxyl carrier protein
MVGAGAVSASSSADVDPKAAGAELLFCAPSSGRFYSRSSPEVEPFVAAGDEIAGGQVVCLLEVMKTFNRIEYGGEGLPARARVVAVLAHDGDDLEAGQPILALARIG